MREQRIERHGNRAIIRSQGMGPYENGILVDVNPYQGKASVGRVRYNHRTMSGDGYVLDEGSLVLDILDWLTIAELIREITGGQDLGPDTRVAESGGRKSKPVPDALSAKSKAER